LRLFGDLLDELCALDLRLDKLDRQLMSLCRRNEACRALSKLPGVGPVIATALVAAVDDGHHFRSGWELAARCRIPRPRIARFAATFAAHGGSLLWREPLRLVLVWLEHWPRDAPISQLPTQLGRSHISTRVPSSTTRADGIRK
jgi:Transposase IS116/IS110/IS902 family